MLHADNRTSWRDIPVSHPLKTRVAIFFFFYSCINNILTSRVQPKNQMLCQRKKKSISYCCRPFAPLSTYIPALLIDFLCPHHAQPVSSQGQADILLEPINEFVVQKWQRRCSQNSPILTSFLDGCEF